MSWHDITLLLVLIYGCWIGALVSLWMYRPDWRPWLSWVVLISSIGPWGLAVFRKWIDGEPAGGRAPAREERPPHTPEQPRHEAPDFTAPTTDSARDVPPDDADLPTRLDWLERRAADLEPVD